MRAAGSFRLKPTQTVLLIGRLIGVVVVAAALTACSGQSATRPAGQLGYGTPGVSNYVGPADAASLQAQLDRCRQVPQAAAATQTQDLPAACAQLQRTYRNQPGNAVQPSQAP